MTREQVKIYRGVSGIGPVIHILKSCVINNASHVLTANEKPVFLRAMIFGTFPSCLRSDVGMKFPG